MATSKTGLVNQALVKLGQSTITNLDTDTSTLANTARTIYDTVRRAVIMAHPWNSVIKRVKLARLSDAPAFGFSYQYQLPTDFIAIYKPEDIRDDYRIELSADSTSRVIVTDCTEFNITYKADVEVLNLMGPGLQECISWKLAMEMAETVLGDKGKFDQMARGYIDALSEYGFEDSIQGQTEQFIATTWVDERIAGTLSDDVFRKIESA